jgi:hypothetical protein
MQHADRAQPQPNRTSTRMFRAAKLRRAERNGCVPVCPPFNFQTRASDMMKKTTAAIAAMALVTLTAGCKSPTEKAAENVADQMEDNADAVRDNAEMTADNMEMRGDNMDNVTDGMDSKAEEKMDNKAAAVRDKAENKADAMENAADAVRDKAK